MSVSWGERLLLLSVTSRKLGSGGRLSRPLLEGWVGGWLDGPPAPGRGPIFKPRGRGEEETGQSEVAFPGLGLGEGMLWNLCRKLSNQLVMGLLLSFSSFLTILVLLLLLFSEL